MVRHQKDHQDLEMVDELGNQDMLAEVEGILEIVVFFLGIPRLFSLPSLLLIQLETICLLAAFVSNPAAK